MVILQDAVWWKYLQIIYIITVRNSWYNLITSLCLAIGLDNLWQSSHSQLVIHLILFLLNPNPKGQVPVNNVHVTFYMMRQWESTYGSLTDIPPHLYNHRSSTMAPDSTTVDWKTKAWFSGSKSRTKNKVSWSFLSFVMDAKGIKFFYVFAVVKIIPRGVTWNLSSSLPAWKWTSCGFYHTFSCLKYLKLWYIMVADDMIFYIPGWHSRSCRILSNTSKLG